MRHNINPNRNLNPSLVPIHNASFQVPSELNPTFTHAVTTTTLGRGNYRLVGNFYEAQTSSLTDNINPDIVMEERSLPPTLSYTVSQDLSELPSVQDVAVQAEADTNVQATQTFPLQHIPTIYLPNRHTSVQTEQQLDHQSVHPETQSVEIATQTPETPPISSTDTATQTSPISAVESGIQVEPETINFGVQIGENPDIIAEPTPIVPSTYSPSLSSASAIANNFPNVTNYNYDFFGGNGNGGGSSGNSGNLGAGDGNFDDQNSIMILKNLIVWFFLLQFFLFLIRIIALQIQNFLRHFLKSIDSWMIFNRQKKGVQITGRVIKVGSLLITMLVAPKLTEILIRNLAIRWNRTFVNVIASVARVISTLFLILGSAFFSIKLILFLCTNYQSVINHFLIKLQGPPVSQLTLFVEQLLKSMIISFFAGFAFHFFTVQNTVQKTNYRFYGYGILSIIGIVIILNDFFSLRNISIWIIRSKLFNFILNSQMGRFGIIIVFLQLTSHLSQRLPITFFSYVFCLCVFQIHRLALTATPNLF